jgi:hypothetical protein
MIPEEAYFMKKPILMTKHIALVAFSAMPLFTAGFLCAAQSAYPPGYVDAWNAAASCDDRLAVGIDYLESNGCQYGNDVDNVRRIFRSYFDWGAQDLQTRNNGGTLSLERLQGRLNLCIATAKNLQALIHNGSLVCSSGGSDGTSQPNFPSGTPAAGGTTSPVFVGGRPGVSYTSNGAGTVMGSDGTVYTTSGNTTVSSNGTIYTTTGNTTLGSNGTVYTRSGNTILGSDGTVCNHNDATMSCN